MANLPPTPNIKVITEEEDKSVVSWLYFRYSSSRMTSEKIVNRYIDERDYDDDYTTDELQKRAFVALFEHHYIEIQRDSIFFSLFCVKFDPHWCVGAKYRAVNQWAAHIVDVVMDPKPEGFYFDGTIFGDKRTAFFEFNTIGDLKVTFCETFAPIPPEKVALLTKEEYVEIVDRPDENGMLMPHRHWPEVKRKYKKFAPQLFYLIKTLAFKSEKTRAWAYAHMRVRKNSLWTKFVNLTQWQDDLCRRPIETCYDDTMHNMEEFSRLRELVAKKD